MTGQRLATVLEQVCAADTATLERAAQYQAREGGTLPRALAALGVASEETIYRGLARALRLDYVAADAAQADPDLAGTLPAGFCRRHLAVPLVSGDRAVRLAMAEPLHYRTIQDVEFRTGRSVTVVVASESTVRALLARLEGGGAPPVAGAKARIMVAEDSPTVAATVRYFLEREGFEVHIAIDGIDGLECARKRRFDVVVADVNMPGMDGLAMVQALRADPRTAGVGVLMITGDRSPDRQAAAFAAGADAYLLKPVDPRRLAATVRTVLDRPRASAHA